MYQNVYYLIANITSGGENAFFSSIEKVAAYFDANYETVRRVFKQLVRDGWLIPVSGENRRYKWVHHNEWAKAHPNGCCERAALVWEHETDPFIGKLYAIADGKLKLYENHVRAMRAIAGDEEILLLYRHEIEAAKARRQRGSYEGTSPLACFWTVHRYLKELDKQRKIRDKERAAEANPALASKHG
ncbi:MAG: hypothetical protein WBL50_17940 [Candidatus Acidiferrum sp.]